MRHQSVRQQEILGVMEIYAWGITLVHKACETRGEGTVQTQNQNSRGLYPSEERQTRAGSLPEDVQEVFNISMVQEEGIEPSRTEIRQILSLVRLPVPPLLHAEERMAL
jgi:hypothetical protein